MMTFLRRLIYQVGFPIAMVYWWIFRLKRQGVKCVVKNGNKILLVRNTYGYKTWTFPGGGVKRGESVQDAARREVMEETGVQINDVKELGELDFQYQGVATIFEAEAVSLELHPDPVEISEAKWFSKDGLPVISQFARQILELWEKQGTNLT